MIGLEHARLFARLHNVYTSTKVVYRTSNYGNVLFPVCKLSSSSTNFSSVHTFGLCSIPRGQTQTVGVTSKLRSFVNVKPIYNLRTQYSRNLSQRRIYKRKTDHFENLVDTKVTSDTLLYHNYRDKYFLMVSIFTVTGFAFWLCTADTIYNIFPKLPQQDEPTEGLFSKINFTKSNIRASFTFLSVIFAILTLTLGTFRIKKSVKEIWLLKGGEDVKIITYNLFSRTTSRVLPLDQVTPVSGRGDKDVVLRAKNFLLKFILDRRGTFPNPALYDFTVGMGRKI